MGCLCQASIPAPGYQKPPHCAQGGEKLLALLHSKHTCNTAMLLLYMPTSRAAPTELLQAVTSCWLSFGVLSSHGLGPQGAQAVEKLFQPCGAAEEGKQAATLRASSSSSWGLCIQALVLRICLFPTRHAAEHQVASRADTPGKKKVRNAQQCCSSANPSARVSGPEWPWGPSAQAQPMPLAQDRVLLPKQMYPFLRCDSRSAQGQGRIGSI